MLYICELLESKMNCWHCKSDLIWNGDHDLDPDESDGQFSMVTSLSCPKCFTAIDVYYPSDESIAEHLVP